MTKSIECMEIRSFGNDAAPRLASGSRSIEGYAIVFGQESEVLYDRQKKRRFTEVIQPGAVTEDLLRRSDVKALLEHDIGRMLARSFKGAGTLTLSIDGYGVKYRFEAPATQDGDYAVEMVRRGDLFGSSFAYATDERANVRYEKRADGMLMRYVDRIDWIGDVSIVSDPAYMGTDVEVRSLEQYYPEDRPDERWQDAVAELRRLAEED